MFRLCFPVVLLIAFGCDAPEELDPSSESKVVTEANPTADSAPLVQPDITGEGAWARHIGDRRAIIKQGNLSARIDLKTLEKVPHLYAVGPVEGLLGEVTIYDGLPSISTVVDGQPHVDVSFDHKAIFLAYASVPEWQTIEVDLPLAGLDSIEAFVRSEAGEAGRSLAEPFAFRIEGVAATLTYHIIFKEDDAPHNKAEHQKAKKKFTVTDQSVKIVGFWAGPEGEGVYTHPGKRTHLHVVLPENAGSGHIDAIELNPNTKLFLPK